MVAELNRIYGELLTENQREITTLYYDCDLSFGEIAEQKGVSRQSVNDTLNKVKAQLELFENKLKFYKKKTELLKIAEKTPLSEKIMKILEEN